MPGIYFFNKDVKLTYSTRNYSEEVSGVVEISLSDLIKGNLFVYISTPIVLAIIITLIVLIKSMAKSSKRKEAAL